VNRFLKETGTQIVEKVSSIVVLCKSVEGTSSNDEIERLTRLLEVSEQERRRLAGEKSKLELVWRTVESSAGWRVLNSWRRAREKLVPLGSHRRKLYDGLLRPLRRKG
jgi:hypothetical protein